MSSVTTDNQRREIEWSNALALWRHHSHRLTIRQDRQLTAAACAYVANTAGRRPVRETTCVMLCTTAVAIAAADGCDDAQLSLAARLVTPMTLDALAASRLEAVTRVADACLFVVFEVQQCRASHWIVPALADLPGEPGRWLTTAVAALAGSDWAFDPAWRTAAAVDLAGKAWATRDWQVMPVLADALEDAGCAAAGVIDYLRGPGPFFQSCKILDELLGRR